MTIEIRVPELGESVLEATVHQWFKSEGDPVEAGEALVELETDKVNLEVGAEQPGILARIEQPDGTEVKVGDLLGVIEEGASQPKKPGGDGAKAEKAAAQPNEKPPAENRPAAEASAAVPAAETTSSQPEKSASATPVAERIARQAGVDLVGIPGSGPGGKVVKSDVEKYLQDSPRQAQAVEPPKQPSRQTPSVTPSASATASATASPSASAVRAEERVKMSRRRRTIAARLVEAQQNTAMLTTFNEIDMTAVMDLRKRRGEAFAARHGVKLGLTSFFVKAAVSALKAFPRLNAQIDGDEMVLKKYYDIGVAIGDPEGLVVPVIRDCDRLTLAEIERKIREYVDAVQNKTLSLEDLRGGTFSITNGGVFGSLMSTPILNYPEVGILGLHKIEDRPVVRDGQMVIRPMMYVAVSYDHRIVDGREAVQFLVRIKELVEDPEALLLEG